jgi:hypothetical protein
MVTHFREFWITQYFELSIGIFQSISFSGFSLMLLQNFKSKKRGGKKNTKPPYQK